MPGKLILLPVIYQVREFQYKSGKIGLFQRSQREVTYFCIFTEVKHIPSAGLLFPEIKRQADIGFHKRSVHPFEDGCDESLGI